MVLSVEQVDIVKLKMGMEVIVYLDAYSDSTYHGVITEINTIPTTAGGITTYSVTVTFEKNYPEEVILAGMGGNAKILIAQTKNVLLVPSQAISRKDGKNVVLRRNSTVWEDREVEV
ncbi:MAG: HlyD family efflux transporter periplasmic adaptor subunit [Candidatus Peribacteria bacterium]|jgi:multidrug efflux pump subunit AcrA (membrane-fusion protein)|nr:HlyD family efflux transporter periplasmic adaptor subunit [Candidatus Peribacteria bacterium]